MVQLILTIYNTYRLNLVLLNITAIFSLLWPTGIKAKLLSNMVVEFEYCGMYQVSSLIKWLSGDKCDSVEKNKAFPLGSG